MIALAILLFVLVVVALRLGLTLVRSHDRRYRLYSAWANEFYSAADRLIENPETPQEVLDFVGEMNTVVNFPHTALTYVRVIQKKRQAALPMLPTKNHFDLHELPGSVVADTVVAIEAWKNAIAYRSLVFGPVLRLYFDNRNVRSTTSTVAHKVSHRHRHMTAHA
jgi:hypothetical protein